MIDDVVVLETVRSEYPMLYARFANHDFASALREMFDRGQGDEGLVFTK